MPRVYGPISAEHKAKLHAGLIGNKYRLGIPHTKEVKEQISNSLKGNTHLLGHKPSVESRNRMSIAGKGRVFTAEHKRKIGEHQKGNKSPWWKGGITALQKAIRCSFEYRQWRADVFKRDDYTCQDCGIRGAYIHAHHIKSLSNLVSEYGIKTMEEALAYPELWCINNGVTLCEECHKNTDSYLKRKAK